MFFMLMCSCPCSDRVQLMFHMERAWWYYEDTLRTQRPELPHYSNYSTFTIAMVLKCDFLKPLLVRGIISKALHFIILCLWLCCGSPKVNYQLHKLS